ncbi:hypothetical protein HN011_010565 [Eciton burchellii]|nr:hypothetical protein HN011_010565 [Eciton burchellii]
MASSSSLTALNVTISAKRNGECNAAIVEGSNFMLRPEYSISLTKLGTLPETGGSKVFDIAANGYTRAETITAVYLQKTKNAQTIYAMVVHSKMNTHGYKSQGHILNASSIIARDIPSGRN